MLASYLHLMLEKYEMVLNELSMGYDRLFDIDIALRQACSHHQVGRLECAKAIYHQILAIEPENPDALHLLGVISHQNYNYKDGIELITRAIEIDPNQSSFFNSLANILKDSGQYQKALDAYNHAVIIDPQEELAHNNIGVLRHEQGQLGQAVDAYRKAIAINPNYFEGYSNLGVALREQGKLDQAVESYQQAIAINPDYSAGYNNLGTVLKEQGKLDQAIRAYRRAIKIDPNYIEAYNNLSHLELLRGNYTEGWHYYMARKMEPIDQLLSFDSSNTDLYQKNILFIHEQGLGDEIFFLRFVPQLKLRGAQVIYRPHPKLVNLVAKLTCIDKVIGSQDLSVEPDLTLALADLPFLMGMQDPTEIPPPISFPNIVEDRSYILDELADIGSPPYIGVTWCAGTKVSHRSRFLHLYKEIPLELIAVLLSNIDATVIILQRNSTNSELDRFNEYLGRKTHDFDRFDQDLENMAKLLVSLDEYIAVSNTNVHLRAAVGKTSRVLVPFPPEWRWMDAGTESTWYPGTALYRQSTSGDWAEGIQRLKNDLETEFWP